MTKEEYQTFSSADKLHRDPLIMKRSRSLSELPGHLRVPILRRKDTERTQARLEAGAAGVEELRALREQQQQIVDQTKAAVQTGLAKYKKKHKSNQEVSDHQRLELEQSRQQNHGRSLSVDLRWSSANSLGSISEEWDTATTVSVDRHRGYSTLPRQRSDHPHQHHQKEQQQQDGRLTHHQQDHYNELYNHHGHHQPHQLQRDADRTQHRRRDHGYYHKQHQDSQNSSVHENNSTLRQNNSSQFTDNKNGSANARPINSTAVKQLEKGTSSYGRRYSSAQDYMRSTNNQHFDDGTILSQMCHASSSTPKYQRHRLVHSQSDERFSRNRSQSVHESFSFFPEPRQLDPEYSILNQQSNETTFLNMPRPTIELEEAGRGHSLHHSRSDSNILHRNPLRMQATLGSDDLSPKELFPNRLTLCPGEGAKPHVPDSKVRSKSISWDNLLIAMGLQNVNTDTDNEIPEQEEDDCDDDIFENAPAQENREISKANESPNNEMSINKMVRSHSFTTGVSPPNNNQSNKMHSSHNPTPSVSPTDSSNNSNDNARLTTRDVISVGRRGSTGQAQTAPHPKSTTLMRRASIQCEAVLTKSKTPSKFVNPLQDVDVNALKSPGPLHAVTLQYCTLPLRSLLENSKVVSSTNTEISPKPCQLNGISEPTFEQAHPKRLKNNSPALQPILEDGSLHTSLTGERSETKIKSSENGVVRQQDHKEVTHSSINKYDGSESSAKLSQTHQQRKPVKTIKSIRRALFQEQTQDSGKNISDEQNVSVIENQTRPIKTNQPFNTGVSAYESTTTNAMERSKPQNPTQKIISCTSFVPPRAGNDNIPVFSERTAQKDVGTNVAKGQASDYELNACKTATVRKVKADLSIAQETNVKESKLRETASANAAASNDIAVVKVHTGDEQQNKIVLSPKKGHLESQTGATIFPVSEGTIMDSNADAIYQTSPSVSALSPHVADTSILSDDGYSTCDSIGPLSLLALGYQSSDLSSLSSGSVGSMSFLGESPISFNTPRNVPRVSLLSAKVKSGHCQLETKKMSRKDNSASIPGPKSVGLPSDFVSMTMNENEPQHETATVDHCPATRVEGSSKSVDEAKARNDKSKNLSDCAVVDDGTRSERTTISFPIVSDTINRQYSTDSYDVENPTAEKPYQVTPCGTEHITDMNDQKCSKSDHWTTQCSNRQSEGTVVTIETGVILKFEHSNTDDIAKISDIRRDSTSIGYDKLEPTHQPFKQTAV